ncbi:P-loop containing nucleoside triphosphate hydrolase protein [Gongronella butleri]|nr:P-loop containing nucleoside triphosphate hydrolase protein [Gongronella butleri]
MSRQNRKGYGKDFDWNLPTDEETTPQVTVNATLNLSTFEFEVKPSSSDRKEPYLAQPQRPNFGPKAAPERIWTMQQVPEDTLLDLDDPLLGQAAGDRRYQSQQPWQASEHAYEMHDAHYPPQQALHHEALTSLTFKLNTDLYEQPVFEPVDNESHFRQQPVVPFGDDILYPRASPEEWAPPADPYTKPQPLPHIPINIVKGPYKSVDHYLATHFELMRQDALIPLQKAVFSYRASVAPNEAPQSLFDKLNDTDLVPTAAPAHIARDFRLYEHVHLNAIVYGNYKVMYRISFRLPYRVRVSWPQSKRLIQGTLVLLSSDHFKKDIKVATVENRGDEPMTGANRFEFMIDISLERDNDDDPLGFGDTTGSEPVTYTMLEATDGYFEAYRHILNRIKTIPSDALPFERHLVGMDQSVLVPHYAAYKHYYDLETDLKRRKTGNRKPVDILGNWPAYDIGMDRTQVDALQTILSNQVAVIQGPPGTGKTYVGTYAMRVLLSNFDESLGPIVCICQTNHALDQFLEHILDYDSRIVRIGSRSKSELLKDNLIYELRKNQERGPIGVGRLFRQRDALALQIDERIMEMYEEPCVTLEMIAKHRWLSPRQIDSLKRLGEREASRATDPTSTIFDDDWVVSSKPAAPSPSSYRSAPPSGAGRGGNGNQRGKKGARGGGNGDRHVKKGPLAPAVSSDWEMGNPNVASPTDEKSINPVEVWLADAIEFISPNAPLHTFSSHLKDELLNPKGLVFDDDNAEEDLVDEDEMGEIKLNFFDAMDSPMRKNRFINIDRAYKGSSGASMADDPSLRGAAYYGHVVGTSSQPQFERKIVNYKKKVETTLHQPAQKSTTKAKATTLSFFDDSDDGDDDDNGDGNSDTSSNNAAPAAQFQENDDQHMVLERWMKEDDVTLWPLPVRLQAHKKWIAIRNQQLEMAIQGLIQRYNRLCKDIRSIYVESDAAICRKSRVVGMTSTAAAKYHDLLEAMKPKVMVVEEAAEMLESHIVTALTASLEHLILIGDHQQLRPSTAVHTLSRCHNMNVSLFERLVANEVPFTRLSHQRRMRPSIRALINPIYSDPPLQDHAAVSQYPDVRGMAENMFFLAHEELEESQQETASKSNPHEAQMAACLAMYLLKQGYKPNEITIITMYAGQRSTIKQFLRNERNNDRFAIDVDPTEIHVSSVDGYQGEENKIIILSLVRSNVHGQIGFLKVANRVCVGLSRAKHGMYILGNARLLCDKSDLWNEIVASIEGGDNSKIGTELVLKCEKHKNKTRIQWPVDFVEVKEGGCNCNCGAILNCGHQCPRKCHTYDHDRVRCEEPCKTIFPECGHACQRSCSLDCGTCTMEVTLTLACRHTVSGACGKIRREARSRNGQCTRCYMAKVTPTADYV